MSAAWEWRGFQQAAGPVTAADLLALAGQAALAIQVAAPAANSVVPETDTYLVRPGLPHNLKVRHGALEVKEQVAEQSGGYSLWLDKVIYPFPLAPQAVDRLWALLELPRRGRSRHAASPDQLIAVLGRHGFTPIRMDKLRVRLDSGAARLEVAGVTVHGTARWWLSLCADGYDLPAVQALVRQVAGSRSPLQAMSYVDFLQGAVLAAPAGTGGVQVRHGGQSP
ncbi:MAG TPA: hypothetical protein VK464_00980 [Symbiobacteriaceae bacterium]|jgi:hypothetical protein|nr:hypothetical protein [Symbiobacteriaceae bacterium]